jgi:hypothetical protein
VKKTDAISPFTGCLTSSEISDCWRIDGVDPLADNDLYLLEKPWSTSFAGGVWSSLHACSLPSSSSSCWGNNVDSFLVPELSESSSFQGSSAQHPAVSVRQRFRLSAMKTKFGGENGDRHKSERRLAYWKGRFNAMEQFSTYCPWNDDSR